ncbi:MAG: hypothetical protein E6R03_03030 [Hyphomicrobiaceae bacterium]|nr:MAG: hypothetical protein E6R03_03030 [Hyphomicrobiaceae bacterium]
MGIVQDMAPYDLPPEAWSDGKNVRMFSGSVWKDFGNLQVFGALSGRPLGLFPIATATTQFYAYPGAAAVWATDGTTHADITRLAGAYTGSDADRWNGCSLGGILILNNGLDVPQAWMAPGLATKLVNLANWPAGYTAKCMRTYKSYLIGMDMTESGTRIPYRVRWSDSAAAGSVPATWALAAGNDARYWDLIESDGFVIDCAPLGDVNYVYKDDSTHSMEYIGGQFVFKFRKAFNFGMLAQDCVREWKGSHIVMTQDDILMHNGASAESLLATKMRDWYRGRPDQTYFTRSFLALSETDKELWACFPQQGQTFPDIALVINTETGKCSIRDIPNTSSWMYGFIQTGSVISTFDGFSGVSFDAMVGQFGSSNFAQGRKRLAMVSQAVNKAFLMEQGYNFDGVNFRSYIERTGLAIIGRDRQGNPKVDFSTKKLLSRIWPKMRVANGTIVKVYAGGQETVDSPVVWKGPFDFRPGIDNEVCVDIEGRLHAVRFETTDGTYWKLDGYDIEIEPIGAY